jgi:hypothetical protein
MSLEGESLGKSRLDLEANLDEFRRNMKEGQTLAGGMDDRLKALAAVADIAEQALGDVKMSGAAATESERIAARIERSVGRDGRAAMEATQHLQEVKLGAAQAAETEAAGHSIIDVLQAINRNANETNRALDRLAAKRGIVGRPGVGVGPFGSGFGRIGLLGTAIGAGALTAPAAAPAALGLLAGIPTLAAGAAGAIATLVLAFKGMGAAIGGDEKAFKKLAPAQQQFVQTIRSMIPWVDRLKQMAGSIMFPGLTSGLRSAMSPGTVVAITNAVAGFARAIGQAGEAWGRYFGSAKFQQIFGPLMASAARNFTVLSNAALSLFDALGVVGKAAIPLVNWLNDVTAKGAALADSWIRAQSASGGLARGMQAAQQSLRLVGGLALSLVRVVVALGRALYPVAQVIVPALTNGFNALARFIDRNRATISEFGVAVVKDVIAVVKTATAVVGTLGGVIDKWFGSTGVRVAIIATGIAIGLAFSPVTTIIAAIILGAGELIRHWTAVKDFFGTLGVELGNAFDYAWTEIERGAIYAALQIVKAFDFKILGHRIIPGVHSLVQSLQQQLDSLHPPNMDWSAAAKTYGEQTGNAWGAGFTASAQAAISKINQQGAMTTVPMEGTLSGSHVFNPTSAGSTTPYLTYLLTQAQATPSSADDKRVLTRIIAVLRARQARASTTLAAKTDLQNQINGYEAQLAALDQTSAFGTPPPFDKNVPEGKKPKAPPLIPPAAQHALDLGATNANKASNATGTVVERYLRLELGDLATAAKLIREKYEGATGRVHTELFYALTSVLNKIRTVRAQLRDAIYQDKLASTQFALDLAQLAMDNAKEGSAAYLKAEHQEEKLLRAEIAYLDKRVRNKKLSLALRQDALSAEISARQQLNALFGQTSTVGSAGANEAQFLSSFESIVQNYAPNAFPEAPTTKPLETKGYETVAELRGIKRLLERLVDREKFPASGYATTSAEAAFA